VMNSGGFLDIMANSLVNRFCAAGVAMVEITRRARVGKESVCILNNHLVRQRSHDSFETPGELNQWWGRRQAQCWDGERGRSVQQEERINSLDHRHDEQALEMEKERDQGL
jgi:hypothetical protein